MGFEALEFFDNLSGCLGGGNVQLPIVTAFRYSARRRDWRTARQ
jgi:hypothetical protein